MMMYSAVVRAPELEIRGMKCRNISDAAMILDGRIPPLTSFRARNMNLAYAKREWLWYLGADKMDDSIMEHAKMWAKLKQEDGSFYSNYGQYIFDTPKKSISQFEYVIKCLKADKFTRRAVIVLLQPHHLYLENTDVVCTYDINFSIEGDYLNMMVMMRSNDAVFGFTNDAFCFWNLMEFVYQIMSTHYPNLQRGYYTHFTNSMHVYERHYKMLQDIVMVPSGDYKSINVPRPTPQEVVDLVKTKGKGGKGEYTTWLSTFD
jgi:thymidylate synthase